MKLLIATPSVGTRSLNKAFLFSCPCGLRVSDVRKLTWSDLQQSGGRVRIEIKMQKTKEPLYLPISDEALKWLPERGASERRRFYLSVDARRTVNDTLQHWAKDSENHQTYLFSHGETSYNLYLIEN
ncbi:MAG: tyrosine-type recombinase/integrase [Alistipes onderdonkii]